MNFVDKAAEKFERIDSNFEGSSTEPGMVTYI
jgi:hypothetical protein